MVSVPLTPRHVVLQRLQEVHVELAAQRDSKRKSSRELSPLFLFFSLLLVHFVDDCDLTQVLGFGCTAASGGIRVCG